MGYQSITVKADSTTAMGVQFEKVGSATGEFPIKELVSGDNILGWNDCVDNADQIWVYTGHDWTKYYFYASNTRKPKEGYWVLSTDASHTPLGDNITIRAGQSFFFRRSAKGAESDSITLAGSVVPLTDIRSVNVVADSTTALAWPWPDAMKIKDFGKYNPSTLGWNDCVDNADQIWVYTGHDWTKYYFYASNTRKPAEGIWVLSTDGTHQEIGDDVIVESGSAFFFRRSAKGDATISFERK